MEKYVKIQKRLFPFGCHFASQLTGFKMKQTQEKMCKFFLNEQIKTAHEGTRCVMWAEYTSLRAKSPVSKVSAN